MANVNSDDGESIWHSSAQVAELQTSLEQSQDSTRNSTSERVIVPMDLDEERPAPDETIIHSSGLKVWLAVAAIYVAYFLVGLVSLDNDLSI